MIGSEQAAGAAEPGLDLVGDEEDVVARADLADPPQVPLGRDDHAALALDRLDDEGRGVRRDRGLERVGVAVRHEREAGGERAEAGPVERLGAEADDRDRAPGEVPLRRR